ncbi:HEAT repeat domain-containing protein [Tychonema sp. LEGE 07203]|uniref:HEAT repeat domain-containing protein n=1 Tax=Tychonema sp. LEGE 07203 TaxID=1828671 RepID=UPI001D14AF0B|nr:HEAT repeat domain-containing protein [Tychonema sp. LEGE 07203]
MLKLVSNDESNNYRRRPGRVDRHNPRNSRPSNPNPQRNLGPIGHRNVSSEEPKLPPALPDPLDFSKGYSLDNSHRPLPFILESGPSESEGAGVEGDRINANSGPLETNSNGCSDTGFNISETTNRANSLASQNQNSYFPETDDRLKVDLIEELIEDLQHLNPARRRKAIWELGQQGDSRAVEPLLDLLASSDSNQYSLILASVSEIGIRTLKPMNNAWSLSLQNENPEVRKNAIRDLTRIYELVNQISHLLHRATDDPDVEVQETARWAINQLNRIHPRSERDD